MLFRDLNRLSLEFHSIRQVRLSSLYSHNKQAPNIYIIIITAFYLRDSHSTFTFSLYRGSENKQEYYTLHAHTTLCRICVFITLDFATVNGITYRPNKISNLLLHIFASLEWIS